MADEMWVKTDISRRTEPCPICGKNDYCFYLTHAIDGNKRYYCHRTQSQTDVTGCDGRYYFYIKHADKSNAEVFESADDRAIWQKKSVKTKNGVGRADTWQPLATGPCEGEVEVASVDERDAFNKALCSYLMLSDRHKESLVKDWNTPQTPNLFEKVIGAYPIFTMAPNDFVTTRYGYKGEKYLPKRNYIAGELSKFFEIPKYPGFVEKADGTKTIISPEGMWFPVYNKDSKLISWRVRCDYPDIKGDYNGKKGTFVHSYGKMGEEVITFYPEDEKEGIPCENLSWPPKGKTQNKYKNLCGVYEKRDSEKVVNGYGKGCRVGSLLSLYTRPGDNMSVCFLTEGEKKAMVANILLGFPVISIPGVNSFMKLFEKEDDGESMMESLQKRGLKMAVVCYDADKAENQHVLKAQDGLADALSGTDLRVAIGEWNEQWGKGLDDILVQGIKPTIYPVSFNKSK